MRKNVISAAVIASALALLSHQAAALEEGYIVPIDITTCPKISNSGVTPSPLSAVTLTTYSTVTYLTFVGIFPYTITVNGQPQVIATTVANVMLSYDSSNNTVSALTPHFNSAGQQTGLDTSTGTYTGSISATPFASYTIAVGATFNAGLLKGQTCNITGNTYFIGG